MDRQALAPRARGWRWWGLLLALALASAGVRITVALTDEAFVEAEREGGPEGMLRSDPALLYYLLQRCVDAGGVPGDLRADARIEHPAVLDVPAEFAFGAEVVLAWGYRLAGGELPLHVFCVVVMALVASLVVVAAGGLAFELGRSPPWALVAALLAALVPASYRTVGFVLMREDVSFPLFAIHLWLVSRAVRRGGAPAFALAALALLGALATWHAAGVLLALEVAALGLWVLATGRAPLAQRGAWVTLPILVLGALAVPVLRSKGLVLSASFLGLFALAAASMVRRHGPRAVRLTLVAGAVAASAGALLAAPGDYAHVVELLGAKLVYLGQLPPDPRALSFDARLLWQGPFATADVDVAAPGTWLALALWIGVARATWHALRPAEGSTRGPVATGGAALGLLALLSVAAGVLVQRMAIVPAFLAAPLAVELVRRLPARRARVVAALGLLLQGGVFTAFVARHEIPWYQTESRRDELRELVAWVDEHVPEGRAVAADFVTSPALLAHTGRPIVFQPKYEAGESRARAGLLLGALFHGDLDELAELLVERFDCHYLVVDRFTVGVLSPYVAGVSPLRGIDPNSAAGRLLGGEPSSVPGFRLLFSSARVSRPESASGSYRVYAVTRP